MCFFISKIILRISDSFFNKKTFLFELLDNSAILYFQSSTESLKLNPFYCIVANFIEETANTTKMIMHYSKHKLFRNKAFYITTFSTIFKFLSDYSCEEKFGMNLFRKHVEKLNKEIIKYKNTSRILIQKLKYSLKCKSISNDKIRIIIPRKHTVKQHSNFPNGANIYEIESKI